MTPEEAKKYFGEKILLPTLRNLNKKKLASSNERFKPKKGRRYWYLYNEYQEEFTLNCGEIPHYVLGYVAFRRCGIAFIQFLNKEGKRFEVPFYDGSMATEKLIPETLSCKEYNIPKDMAFVIDDIEGKVKIVD